jgi:CRP-like cAMP-binding protein
MEPRRVSNNFVSAASRAAWRASAGPVFAEESTSVSLQGLIEMCGVRRRVHGGEPLFLPVDATRYWYFLEAGSLRVFRPEAEGEGTLVTLLGPGKFFSFDSGGRYELGCEAMEASTVICLDRRKVDRLARQDPALAELLKIAARGELELTLQSATGAANRRLERVARRRAEMDERRPRHNHERPLRAPTVPSEVRDNSKVSASSFAHGFGRRGAAGWENRAPGTDHMIAGVHRLALSVRDHPGAREGMAAPSSRHMSHGARRYKKA